MLHNTLLNKISIVLWYLDFSPIGHLLKDWSFILISLKKSWYLHFFGSSSHIKCFPCFTAKETISIRCRYLLFLNLYFKCSRIFHSVLHAKFQFNSREGMFLGYQKETSICVCVFLRKIHCLLMKLPTNKSPISKMSGDE